jgi:hypothetical protein
MSKKNVEGDAPAEEAAHEEVAPKEPRRGVGTVAMEHIRAGRTNEETLALVRAEFPEASTSASSINWYRNKLRKDGEDVPTARSLTTDQRAEAKAEKAKAKEDVKAAKKAERDAAKAEKKRTATTSADAAEGDACGMAAAGEGEDFLS